MVVVGLAPCLAQGISLLSGSTFHDASWDNDFGALEDASTPDNGGQMYLLLRNITSGNLVIDSVQVQDLNGTAQVFDGWFNWPDTMTAANGNLTTLLVKGINAPLAEGSDVKIVVYANGEAHPFDFYDLATPSLRICNAIPSNDGNALWLYVRNDGASSITLDSLFLNDLSYSLAATGQMVTLFGASEMAANETRILNIQAGLDLSVLAPYAIRLKYNDDQWVSAAIRISPPEFPIGSWHSSGADPAYEYGRKRMRRLGVEMLQGPGNYGSIENSNQEYHIRAIREAGFGDPFDPQNAIAEIQSQANNNDIVVWTVDDEPDLSGKPIDQQLVKAEAYRQNDPNTPVHINLAVQKKFQRYGWYSDIVSMDHYAAPSAPNVIPLTYIPFIGRMSEIEEAYAYSHSLKLNTEPRRMWSWVQFAGSVWDVQPEPISVNYQYWAHIAAGAKGMEWFVAQSQTLDEFPEQWAEGEKLFKEFKQIRYACLYGEPSNLASSDNPNVLVYALQGPEAMVIFAFNNSVEFSGNALTGYNTDHAAQHYTVTVSIPSWFQFEDAYRVSPEGRAFDMATTTTLSTVTITPDQAMDERMHVYVLAKADNSPPSPLTGLNVSEYLDSAHYTLSWKEPFDNMGVQGYLIHYNNVLVGNVAAPIFEVDSQTIACSGHYRITPYDNAGNLGLPDSVEFVLSGPEFEIDALPEVQTLGDGYQLSSASNGLCSYQWQYFSNTAGWTNLVDDQFINGSNAASMSVLADFLYELGSTDFRCILTSPCGTSLTSESVTIAYPFSVQEVQPVLFNVFPNPTQGRFQVQFGMDNHGGTLTVFDGLGQKVQELAIGVSQIHQALDLSGQPSQIYLLSYLNARGQLSTQRVVLQN